MNQKTKALRKALNFSPADLKFYIAVTGHRKAQNACNPNDSDLLIINSIYVWSCESVQDCRCACEQQYAHTMPCSTSNKITNYIFKTVYKFSDISASVQVQCATFSEQIICECLNFSLLDFEKPHDVQKQIMEFYVRYKVCGANGEANLYIEMHKYEVGSVELLDMYMFDSSPCFLTMLLLQRHSQSIRAVNRRP